jgi:radical SAM protein with 4Fe4S-binding SPASM domain
MMPRLPRIGRVFGSALAATLRLPRPLAAPLEVWIEPTDRCPGACVLCPHSRRKADARVDGHFMTDATLDRLLPALERWQPHVNLHHRGEPFLHPNIAEIIRRVSGAGAHVTLHTGGLVSAPAPVEALFAAGLRELVISLGAATPERFTALRPGADRAAVIERTRESLTARRPHGPRVIVEVFALGDARRELASASDLFAAAPPDAIHLRPVHNWAGATSQGPGGRDQGSGIRSRCLFPFYAMVVLWDGRVVACPQDFDARLVVGAVDEDDLESIWAGEALCRLRRRSRADLAADEPCRACDRLHRRGLLGLPMEELQVFGRRKVFTR